MSGSARSLHFTSYPAGGSSATLTIRSFHHPVTLAQSASCAPQVLVGHTYRVSLRYKSTTRSLRLEVLSRVKGSWRASSGAQRLAARRSLTTSSVIVGPIQGGIDRIDLALVLSGAGSVTVTGFSVVDVSAHPGTLSSGGALTSVVGSSTPAGTTTVNPPPSGLPPAGRCQSLAVEEPPAEKTTVPPPTGNPAEVGQWKVLEGIEHSRTIHAVLLQNGKLLLMAGSGNSRMEFEAGCFRTYVFNPNGDTWKEIQTPTDVFCAGHVQLTDGNVLILGGTRGYPPVPKANEYPSTVYKGENASWIFNIHTEKYEEVPWNHSKPNQPKEPGPLLNGAWYPSATELGNGDVISFGGLNEQGEGATATNYYTDPANEGTDGDNPGEWVGFGSNKLQQTYDWFWGLYPSMILTADGRLFYDGSHVFGNGIETKLGYEGPTPAAEGSALYDFYCTPGKSEEAERKEQNETNPNAIVEGPNGKFKRSEATLGLKYADKRDQSASLLLPPAQDQKVMIMGGGNTYETGGKPEEDATNSTQEINLLEASPHWTEGPNLPRGEMDNGEMEAPGMGKMYVSAVALPDGTVLETGGAMKPRTDDVHEASIFNPAAEGGKGSFTSVAADPVGRDYHSEALLLPDGRVLALGSNPVNVGLGTEGFETRLSIYEPAYLFKGPRPVITGIEGEANHLEGSFNVTRQWEYGEEHTIDYSTPSEGKPVTSAVLIRPAAVTHSSDPNQREVALPVTHNENGELKVSLTSNDNIAPPGYYMVFLVNSEGVPSVAQWVHVGTPTT